MYPLNEADYQAHATVEAALQSYPRVQAPVGLHASVMERLQTLPRRAVPLPKFQFPWLELFVSLVLPLVLGVAWFVWRILPPVYLARLRVQWLIVWQQIGLMGRGEMLEWLIPLGMLLAVTCFGLAATLFTLQRSQN